MNLGEPEHPGGGPADDAPPPTDDQIEELLRLASPSDTLRGGPWTELADFDLVDAVTVLDTAIDQPDGLRSAVGLEGRQIVAEARGVTVVVDIERAAEGYTLSGEILDAGDDVAIVQLVDQVGMEAGIAVCDPFGRFELPADPGSYALVVCTGNLEITVAVELD